MVLTVFSTHLRMTVKHPNYIPMLRGAVFTSSSWPLQCRRPGAPDPLLMLLHNYPTRPTTTVSYLFGDNFGSRSLLFYFYFFWSVKKEKKTGERTEQGTETTACREKECPFTGAFHKCFPSLIDFFSIFIDSFHFILSLFFVILFCFIRKTTKCHLNNLYTYGHN
jgi:hypothetical protein